MQGYLRVELLRTVRDPLYIFQGIVVPIGFYLLFSGLFGSGPHAPGTLPGTVEIMVANAIFAGIWGCLVVTSPRIAGDRTNGWLKNLQLLPIASSATTIGRAVVAACSALPAILAVCVTAVVVHGVAFGAAQWVALVALMWLGVWPFAILGIILGSLTNADSAYGVTTGLYFVVSALGGLWVPPAIMPAGMLAIAKLLPSYQAANLGWHIAGNQGPTLTSALVLLAWMAVFILAAAFIAPRAAKGR